MAAADAGAFTFMENISEHSTQNTAAAGTHTQLAAQTDAGQVMVDVQVTPRCSQHQGKHALSRFCKLPASTHHMKH
jgi:hypothetical protein